MIGQTALWAPDKDAKLRDRVELRHVDTATVRQTLERFHYLHRARVGRQINYAVTIDGMVDGVITYAYPMTSAAICGVPSDELLEFARLYLHQNIPHTASCAIGKSLRRVQNDWMQLFPNAKLPRLIVSWSDATRHLGIVYKAANFAYDGRMLGQHGPGHAPTTKRGRREKHDDQRNEKDRWVYWLPEPRRTSGLIVADREKSARPESEPEPVLLAA